MTTATSSWADAELQVIVFPLTDDELIAPLASQPASPVTLSPALSTVSLVVSPSSPLIVFGKVFKVSQTITVKPDDDGRLSTPAETVEVVVGGFPGPSERFCCYNTPPLALSINGTRNSPSLSLSLSKSSKSSSDFFIPSQCRLSEVVTPPTTLWLLVLSERLAL